MSVSDYIGLEPQTRQILEYGEIPAAAVSALDLVPLNVLVFYPAGFENDYWAIGFRTAAGLVGPYEIDAQGVTEIHAARPRIGAINMVGWTEVFYGLVREVLAASEPVTSLSSINLGTVADSDVIVVDLGAGTVEVVDEFTAFDLELDRSD